MRIYENRVKICKFISKENDDLPMHMMHIMSENLDFYQTDSKKMCATRIAP